jgi:hypothetical protein
MPGTEKEWLVKIDMDADIPEMLIAVLLRDHEVGQHGPFVVEAKRLRSTLGGRIHLKRIAGASWQDPEAIFAFDFIPASAPAPKMKE